MNLASLKDEELINIYPALMRELKERRIIKTKNVVGELGKYFAFYHYKNSKHLPNLQVVPNSVKNISAVDPKTGNRYAVKVTSGTSTGVFHSISTSTEENEKYPSFEYLIIVKMNEDMNLEMILECSWETFMLYKKIKKPEMKWHIQVNDQLIRNSRKIKTKIFQGPNL